MEIIFSSRASDFEMLSSHRLTSRSQKEGENIFVESKTTP